MSRADLACLITAIAEYDGKNINSLKSIAARISPSPTVLNALCDLLDSDDGHMRSASSWLLRRYVSAGAALSPRQTQQVLRTLQRDTQHGWHWQARLHLLQMMGDLCLPAACAEPLWCALCKSAAEENKFIRAWSYSGLAVIAEQYPSYRGHALVMLAAAEYEGAASTRARVRQIRKAFKWAR